MSTQAGSAAWSYSRESEALENAERYAAEVRIPPAAEMRHDDVRVEWEAGSACAGYKELQREVRKLVADRLPGLIAEALTILRGKEAHARDVLLESLGYCAPAYATPPSAPVLDGPVDVQPL
jgi:hypothetical protein